MQNCYKSISTDLNKLIYARQQWLTFLIVFQIFPQTDILVKGNERYEHEIFSVKLVLTSSDRHYKIPDRRWSLEHMIWV